MPVRLIVEGRTANLTCVFDISAGAMATLAVKASGIGSEDNGLNWLVFELLWRDFFRCTFIL